MKFSPDNSGTRIGSRPKSITEQIEEAKLLKVVSSELERRQGTMAGEVIRRRYELGQTDPEISEALGIEQDNVRDIINKYNADTMIEASRHGVSPYGKSKRKSKRR